MPENRPHILLLIGEDTGLHLRCYGDPTALTPHLDRLAQQGYRFLHAFSTAPVCAPSRCSIVTGKYPWSIGTHLMRCSLLRPPRMFTHELRDAGYHVNWWSKTDFNFVPPPDFADRTDDWLTDLRTGGLPAQPWLLYNNFPVTHESTMWDRAHDHDRGFSVLRVENTSLLSRGPRRPSDVIVPAYLPDTPHVRADLARYYDALEIQDAQIGQVLAALDQSPYANDTIVIYMADHGRGLPREKRWCYEAGLHLPLIVRVPEKWRAHAGLTERPGSVVDTLVSWVDLAPTVLSLTSTPIPADYQGRAFLGPARRNLSRSVAFAGRDRMDETYDWVRVARDHRYHYIRNLAPNLPYAQRNLYMERQGTTREIRRLHAEGQLTQAQALWMSSTKPAEELYDSVTDPQMIHNRVDQPAMKPVLERLRRALDEHLSQVGDLGAVDESELVARGLIRDDIAVYRARIKPLPPEHRIGPEMTVFTLNEARAYRA